MELFSEIYNTYYRTVEMLLKKAAIVPMSAEEIRILLDKNSFAESTFHILPKLLNREWPFLRESNGSFVSNLMLPEEIPLSTLQKSWLKAILRDPKIRLFFDQASLGNLEEELREVEPLYDLNFFHFFDSSKDKDNYEDEVYRKHFQQLLESIREKNALRIVYESGKGHRLSGIFVPYKIEYSTKDDKFRLVCYRLTNEKNRNFLLNVARIAQMTNYERKVKIRSKVLKRRAKKQELTFEITRERNALERCMVHFAHFEKRTEYDFKTDKYICILYYDPADESELVIRMLSFGPTIKILAPKSFVAEIRQRIILQNELIFNYS